VGNWNGGRQGRYDGGQRRSNSYTEAQHNRIHQHVLLHVIPAKAASPGEAQIMRDLIAILKITEWKDGSQISKKAASAVIDWLGALPWAEGCEPAAPGLYRDQRTEAAGGQLLIVLERQAPKSGVYAMLLEPVIPRRPKPGQQVVLKGIWDREHADTAGLTEEMRVTGDMYERVFALLDGKLQDRLTSGEQDGGDVQDAAAELAAVLAGQRDGQPAAPEPDAAAIVASLLDGAQAAA
jgi:hypothetical protein